eukprot:14743447-Heterocapsa_arctica.AAC.1
MDGPATAEVLQNMCHGFHGSATRKEWIHAQKLLQFVYHDRRTQTHNAVHEQEHGIGEVQRVAKRGQK